MHVTSRHAGTSPPPDSYIPSPTPSTRTILWPYLHPTHPKTVYWVNQFNHTVATVTKLSSCFHFVRDSILPVEGSKLFVMSYSFFWLVFTMFSVFFLLFIFLFLCASHLLPCQSQAMEIVRTVGQAFEVCRKQSLDDADEQDILGDPYLLSPIDRIHGISILYLGQHSPFSKKSIYFLVQEGSPCVECASKAYCV